MCMCVCCCVCVCVCMCVVGVSARGCEPTKGGEKAWLLTSVQQGRKAIGLLGLGGLQWAGPRGPRRQEWGSLRIRKKTCTPMFSAALFTIAKTWRQPKCPSTGEWIKYTYINTMEYYSAIKNNEIMPFAATWMCPEIIILRGISQIEKDKYHMVSFVCGI